MTKVSITCDIIKTKLFSNIFSEFKWTTSSNSFFFICIHYFVYDGGRQNEEHTYFKTFVICLCLLPNFTMHRYSTIFPLSILYLIVLKMTFHHMTLSDFIKKLCGVRISFCNFFVAQMIRNVTRISGKFEFGGKDRNCRSYN